MQQVIHRIAETLIAAFDGKTVGDGGDFSGSGSISLSGTGHGPFDLNVFTNQWKTEQVTTPSINFRPIQSEPMGRDRIWNTGGKQRLWTQFRVTVDQQEHGQSIAGVLDQALRSYLDTTRFQPSGTGREVYIDSTQCEIILEGQLLHYDYLVLWNYHL